MPMARCAAATASLPLLSSTLAAISTDSASPLPACTAGESRHTEVGAAQLADSGGSSTSRTALTAAAYLPSQPQPCSSTST